MMTILFGILMLAVFGKMLGFALKATWGLTKILFFLVLLPVFLIGIFIAGLIYIAFPLLIIIGILTVVKTIF